MVGGGGWALWVVLDAWVLVMGDVVAAVDSAAR